MSVMVIGGAGYIGAHVVRLLLERGEKVVVVDDLSYGSADRIGRSELVVMDVADTANTPVLTKVMVAHQVQSLIHFAARKQVGESVAKPAWYYQQNVGGLANVLLSMEQAQVKQIVFSSSAAVYGMPPVEVVPEDIELEPINPYGQTKLIGEWMMRAGAKAWGLNWVGLRYFNVAGAGADDLGDMAILNLIPMVFDRLADGKPPLIFGTDYPTPDGTCVRDYIHVQDLATAHLDALDYMSNNPLLNDNVFNVGTGQGYSVREVVDTCLRVAGSSLVPEEKPPRPGDPPQLIADSRRIGQVLGWKASHDLEQMVRSAYGAWQAGSRPIP